MFKLSWSTLGHSAAIRRPFGPCLFPLTADCLASSFFFGNWQLSSGNDLQQSQFREFTHSLCFRISCSMEACTKASSARPTVSVHMRRQGEQARFVGLPVRNQKEDALLCIAPAAIQRCVGVARLRFAGFPYLADFRTRPQTH